SLRTLMDLGDTRSEYAELSLLNLFRRAYAGFEGKKLDLTIDATVAKLEEFATERLRGLIASISSNAVADAVLGGHALIGDTKRPVVAHPAYAAWKARALQKAVDGKEAWLDAARTVVKRLAGISKAQAPRFHGIAALGEADADRAKNGLIVELIEKVDA